MFIDNLKKLSFWSKFVGVCCIVFGVILIIFGLIALVVPSEEGILSGLIGLLIMEIPAVIVFIIGLKLCKAANNARALSYSVSGDELDKNLLSDMVEKYTSAFRIMGIYIIVAIVLFVIIFLIMIVVGVSFMGKNPELFMQ
ncbi:MAG: DUF5362 family protein [Clostridiaceae bacterium]